MAEWLNAAALKAVELKGSVGSNPTPAAASCKSLHVAMLFSLILQIYIDTWVSGLNQLPAKEPTICLVQPFKSARICQVSDT